MPIFAWTFYVFFVYVLLILAAFCSSAGLPGSPLGLPGPPLGSLGLPVDKSSLCPSNSPPPLTLDATFETPKFNFFDNKHGK